MSTKTTYEISDYDVRIIITSVIRELEDMVNPPTEMFRSLYGVAVRCYLRGRNIYCSSYLLGEVMSRLADYVKHKSEYKTFHYWNQRVHEDDVAKALLTWDEDEPQCECGHPNCGDGVLWCGCNICSEWYTDECYCRHWEETGDDEEFWVP